LNVTNLKLPQWKDSAEASYSEATKLILSAYFKMNASVATVVDW